MKKKVLHNIWPKLLKNHSPILMFFYPLSVLWDFLHRLRRLIYKYFKTNKASYRAPVISVGNLTFGGTGKTPFTLYLSDLMAQRNLQTLIVMRGHKGKKENSHALLKPKKFLVAQADEFGDECLIYARRMKKGAILVGKNRSQNLDFYFHKENPDVIILDDGFQHLKIERDLNIVLFDASQPLSYYKVFPLGNLRENLNALKDADLIGFGRSDLISSSQLKKLKSFLNTFTDTPLPSFNFRYRVKDILNYHFLKTKDLIDFKNERVLVVSGLAGPDSLFQMLEKIGVFIIEQITFEDHHIYSTEELENIHRKAEESNALILTTEKDIVKMRTLFNSERLFFLEIELQVIEGEEFISNQLERILS